MFSVSASDLYNVALKTAASGKATVYLPGENNCNFTTTILGLTANSDVITNVPVVNPYGFASMPDDQSYTAVIGNLGIRNQLNVVLGYTNGVKQTSPLQLQKGETGLFNSTHYAIEVKLTELKARFKDLSCKFINGNAGQKLYSDIFNEFILLVDYLNLQTQTIYNLHVHNLPSSIPLSIPSLTIDASSLTVVAPAGGGTCTVSGGTATSSVSVTVTSPTPTTVPIPTMAPYVYTNPIVADSFYIDGELLYIDDDGIMPP